MALIQGSKLEFIEKKAMELLIRYSDGVFPVSPRKIAKKLGIKVIEKHKAMELIEALDVPENIKNSFAFYVWVDGMHIIIIDTINTTAELRRFWLAHEIAHVVFEVHEYLDFDGLFISNDRTSIEIACDIFSFHLLMPSMVLKALKVTDTQEIAKICGVSELVAQFGTSSYFYSPRSGTGPALTAYLKFKPFIENYLNQKEGG